MEKEFKIGDVEVDKIVDHEHVKEKFISILTSIHKMSKEDAASIYEKERVYFLKAFNNPASRLKECTKISIFSSFIEIAIQNLSIQDGAKSEAYLESRPFNVGTKDNKKWEQIARFVITTYGELNLRIRAGQIVRMSNPIVIYEGDRFQPCTNERGELKIVYEPAIPRKSSTIIGSWIAIHLPGNGIDFKWLLQDDIDRLRIASIPKGSSSSGPNALYNSGRDGQIDTGFLETKTIKHAMRAYTKLRLAGAAVIEGDEYEEQEQTAQPHFVQQANTKIEDAQKEVVVVEDDNGLF